MKCEICKSKIEDMYLKKIKGTYLKDEKGKKHAVCSECQRKLSNEKEKLLAELK